MKRRTNAKREPNRIYISGEKIDIPAIQIVTHRDLVIEQWLNMQKHSRKDK
jgi:hypothetical protein